MTLQTMTRLLPLAALIAALFTPAFAEDGVPPPEPESYRMEPMHAPTPATLKGAKVLTTEQAIALWEAKGALFIDALARPPRPEGLPKGVVWRDPPRKDIPGSIWLANTGFGALSEAAQSYFEKALARATQGDKARAIVFYCRKDCWASWNAAKRALALGYTNISWYPEGTTGWEAAGRKLELREPEPPLD